MCNSIPSSSSSSCLAPKRLSPPQSNEGSAITTAATETLSKRLKTLSLEPSPSLQQVTVHTPSYFVYRFKELMINLNNSSSPSTVEINEQGYQILKDAVKQYCGEVVLNELLETFLKGNEFLAPNTKIAKELFLFGEKNGIRFRIQVLDALRSTGFGFSDTPQLIIKSSLSERSFQTNVCSRSELHCLFPTRESFPTLIETLRTDKTIVGLTIGCVEEIHSSQIIKKNPEKETLPLKDRQLPILLNSLTECSQLSSLTIELCGFYGIGSASALAAHITNNSSLTYLRLYYTLIDSSGVTEILRAMSSNSSITTLNISGFEDWHDATDEDRNAFKEALTNMICFNTTLTNLCLLEVECSAAQEVIAKNLNHNSSLTHLTLCNDSHLTELLQTLKHNTTLIQLNNSDAEVYTSAIEALVELIEVNTTLRDIDISAYPTFHIEDETLISDEDGQALARALSKNTTLTALNIHNIDMSDLTAHLILAGLRSNTTLQKLHFFQRKDLDDSNRVVESIQELFGHNSTLTDLTYNTRIIPPPHIPHIALTDEDVRMYPEYRKNRTYEPVTTHTERSKANALQRNMTLFQQLFDKMMLEVM